MYFLVPQSFYFYIPHERRRPGGHISTQSAIPHPWHPFNGVVLNRTARARKSDVVTVRLVSITLTILFAQCIYSDLNAGVGTLWHYPTALVNWYIHTLSWDSTLAIYKYQSFSYLHTVSFKKCVATRVTWFQVYVSLEAWIYRYGSFCLS